jgi:hypothetical protein
MCNYKLHDSEGYSALLGSRPTQRKCWYLRAPVIKSNLIERIAQQNPHLFAKDVEKGVNTILGEIAAALIRRDRVELRGFGKKLVCRE